jgi:hypothetical protein
VSEEAVTKLGVISVSLTQGSDALLSQFLCRTNRFAQPPEIGGPGKLQNPTRHRDGNPVNGELTYERV